MAGFESRDPDVEARVLASFGRQGFMAHIGACPSQKFNLGADHADLVPSRERGRAESMAGYVNVRSQV